MVSVDTSSSSSCDDAPARMGLRYSEDIPPCPEAQLSGWFHRHTRLRPVRRWLHLRGPILSYRHAPSKPELWVTDVRCCSISGGRRGREIIITRPGESALSLFALNAEDLKVWFTELKRVSDNVSNFYHICAQVSHSSTGPIHLGRDKSNDETVAIHVHEKSLLKESEMILLSKRDKMVIKATQEHVNLLSLVDIFETSSHFYTITELVTGGPLHDIMTSQPILNPLARSIMMDILSGLAHLHEAGLVYGAVEASNVVCTRGRFPCRVKLVTYGVARSRGEMTARGSVGSAAGDVHAAGLLMFRLLCGLDAGSGVWDRVGEAEGLLRKMLENEAGKRPTARECLTYDWFSASCYSKNGGGIESGAFVRLESDPKTVITDFEVKDRETKERGRKCVKWMIQEDIVDQGRIESVAYEDLDIKKP